MIPPTRATKSRFRFSLTAMVFAIVAIACVVAFFRSTDSDRAWLLLFALIACVVAGVLSHRRDDGSGWQ